MEPDINESLTTTITRSGGADILSELGEIALDDIIDNEAINQIPIIGTLRGMFKIANSISNYLFLRKLLKFLQNLGSFSAEDRHRVSKKINDGNQYAEKVGTRLLEIIDKLDDIDKTKIVARLFRVYLLEQITYEKFIRYTSVVNRAILFDLRRLKELTKADTLSSTDAGTLLGLGLIDIKSKANVGPIGLRELATENQVELMINDAGRELSQYIGE